LKRMNRKYTKQIFLETIEKLKKRDPDFTFTTDVIVGFPGETEGDFEETIEMMKEVEFAKVHMFPYSDRKRTRAALYPNKVPVEVIQKRKQVVLRVAEEIAFSLREKYVGRTMKVLMEGDEKDGYLSGHTENFLTVMVAKENLNANDLILVKLSKNTPLGLVGERCG
jgi:threonylcarbamoyladenosine tRNA methylthiotransferase MtaB